LEEKKEIPGETIPKSDDLKDNPKPVSQNLTVGQFLKRSPKKSEIDGLIRSLYSSRIMTFEEWNKEISSLLKKKIN
jgi:hypothetical protein